MGILRKGEMEMADRAVALNPNSFEAFVVAAHVLEWQHGDGRFVWERRDRT